MGTFLFILRQTLQTFWKEKCQKILFSYIWQKKYNDFVFFLFDRKIIWCFFHLHPQIDYTLVKHDYSISLNDSANVTFTLDLDILKNYLIQQHMLFSTSNSGRWICSRIIISKLNKWYC